MNSYKVVSKFQIKLNIIIKSQKIQFSLVESENDQLYSTLNNNIFPLIIGYKLT
jgi:hypothetical protein